MKTGRKQFKTIASHCEAQSELCASVIENFLLYYAAARDGLNKDFDQRIKPYRHVADPGHVPGFKSQYIAHRVFRAGGTLPKCLKQSRVKQLPADQLDFLHQQGERPWRMCFSVIKASPEPDFYEMEDVLTGESFLLYSRATTQIMTDYPVFLWLNLIGWNGQCWQTFGPVTGFRSFGLEDIFYFATEINPRIESENDLAADLDRNPVPYMMLYSGSILPLVVHRNQVVALTGAEVDLPAFDSTPLKKDFLLEYSHGVYRVTPRRWADAFECPEVYYDEKQRTLLAQALTMKGFQRLATRLIKLGYQVPKEPQFSVQLTMLETMGSMLRRKNSAHPYEHLFEKKPDPQAEEELERINRVLGAGIAQINNGQMPDVKALAKESGLDEAALTKIFRDTLHRLKR